MNAKQLPIHLENTNISLYGNLGERIGAGMLDAVFLAPVTILMLVFNSRHLDNYYYTFFFSQLVIAAYCIFLPVRYGATPGKRIMGLTILKMDGSAVSYRESFLKYSPMLVLGLLTFIDQCVAIARADEAVFSNLDWMHQSTYLKSLSPLPMWLQLTLVYGYYLATIILVLTDKRNRSVSDQLAGTAVVYTRTLDRIIAFTDGEKSNGQ